MQREKSQLEEFQDLGTGKNGDNGCFDHSRLPQIPSLFLSNLRLGSQVVAARFEPDEQINKIHLAMFL